MAETLTVARRVAEEAIDEAISKAEFDTSNQVIHVFPLIQIVACCSNLYPPIQSSTGKATLCWRLSSICTLINSL